MNPSALLSAVLTVLGWGTGTVCDKLAVRGFSPQGLVLARSLVAAVALSIWGLAAGLFREIATAGLAPVAWTVAGSLTSQVFGQIM